MKTAALATTLLAAGASAHDFKTCADPDYLGITSVDCPDPVSPGGDLAIAFSGVAGEDITSATGELKVKVLGITIDTAEFDVCKDAGVSCPVAKGDTYGGTIHYTTPSAAPAGATATGEFTVKNGDGKTEGCISVDVKVGSSELLAAEANGAPAGSYSGSVTELGQTVNAEVDVVDDANVNIKLSGAISVDCSNEAYTYDGDSTIDIPGKDTSGDCVHDALDTYKASLESITYDAAGDAMSVTTKVPLVGEVTIDLAKTFAVAATPSGTYTGSVTELGQKVTGEFDVIDDTHANIILGGAISATCNGEEYSYDGDSTIDVPGKDTAGDCVHDQLDTYKASLEGVAYDASGDTITVTTKVPLVGNVDMTLTKTSFADVEDNMWLVEQSWSSFKETYGKSYATEEEHDTRKGHFINSLGRILERNAHSEETTFGVTKFSDLSPEEFKAQFLNYRGTKTAEIAAEIPVFQRRLREETASSYDWRDHSGVTDVKDQGYCGSCWAFSATEQIESQWALAGNDMVELAPQAVVSCDKVDAGCNGGDLPTAFDYVEGAKGLPLETDYPYTSGSAGRTGTCKSFTPAAGAVKSYSYATPGCTDECTSQDEDTLAKNIAGTAPAAICVDAEPWQDYTSGVMTNSGADCASGYDDLDHCVQLVGYSGYNGADGDNSQAYWIVRNSWNTNWGIDGYIHLKMGENTCGVADEAMFVQF